MSYLFFDKTELINLENSLTKEYLRTNRAGSYSSSTIISCHTRRYHGLLVCPLGEQGGENHVLLSALDETILQEGKEFHLAVRKYPNVVHPGHKYITEFYAEPTPTIEFMVGDVHLRKEMVLSEKEEQILIKYTFLKTAGETTLRLHPFLAFRLAHNLTRANVNANTRYEDVPGGIRTRMYDVYPYLYMQLSKNAEYVHAPDWFCNVEYIKEQERGYDFQEDLYNPGYFELHANEGDQIIFSAALSEVATGGLKRKFSSELKKRTPRDSYENCLVNSAQQFVSSAKGKASEIVAGFPYFGSWGRDSLISLPGLLQAKADVDCKGVLGTMAEQITSAVYKSKGNSLYTDRASVDTPLWFFWTLQQCNLTSGNSAKSIWNSYGDKLKQILTSFKDGADYNVKLQENGLIYAGEDHVALTWMDAYLHGRPVTPRTGFAVEINALWYNALMYSLELAKGAGDTGFVEIWQPIVETTKLSFLDVFWDDSKGYLADCAGYDYEDWAVRPSQVIAVGLPYTPCSDDIIKSVLDVAKSELLTPRGLRSLSPKNKSYKPECAGSEEERSLACHNGTAWPWLLVFYVTASFKINGRSVKSHIEKIYAAFEEEMTEHGIGSISENFDGDPPHQGRGAISQAWSVSALLSIKYMLDNL